MPLPNFVRNPSKLTVLGAIVGAVVIVALVQSLRLASDPDFVFLSDRGDALWIYHPYAKSVNAIAVGTLTTAYMTPFSVSRLPAEATLEVRALKSFRVQISGKVIRDFDPSDPQNWRKASKIDLKPHLAPGNHRLEIVVQNEAGPTAVWASCPELNIRTDDSWTAYLGSNTMGEVELARAPRVTPLSREFGSAWGHFLRALPLILPVFVVSLVIAMRYTPEVLDRHITQRRARLGVGAMVLALILLGLNNVFRLRLEYGFDTLGHHEYVRWITDGNGIPIATDGWQMFQSPLYYLVAAPLYAIFDSDTSSFVRYFVRIISVICGAMQPIIAWRFALHIWPEKPRLQILAALFAGLLPVNVYMSQFVGNEPMAGLWGALALLLGARILKQETPPSVNLSIACGIVLGLALLTKASALLLIPPCLAAFTSSFWGRAGALGEYLKKTGIVAGLTFLISGWYYIRNWILLGRPFVGGWESREGIEWWQAPGFRMSVEYLRFGEALLYPIYSAFCGFWDSLYSTFWLDGMFGSMNPSKIEPVWNPSLLAASAWLALIPTMILFTGFVAPFAAMLRQPGASWSFRERLHLFATGTILLYLAAIFYVHLRVPIWSSGKASYFLACTPAFAYLAVCGFSTLATRGPRIRAVLTAALGTWVVTVYITYFSLAPIITDFQPRP